MNNFAVLRFSKVKSQSELRNRSAHNHRKGKIPDHVDVSRVNSNELMRDAVKKFKELTDGKKMRKNGVLAVEAVMSFSPEMIGKIDVRKWSGKSIGWMERIFGKENILEIALHLDEKTPHLHVIFAPRDEKGKWNWRGLCPGRQGMRNMQTSYAEEVKDFGLSRGEAKVGRHHVPPEIHRRIEGLRIEVEKAHEMGKKESMERESKLFDLVKAYLGEAKYIEFLRWVKRRERAGRESKKLEKDLKGPEMA